MLNKIRATYVNSTTGVVLDIVDLDSLDEAPNNVLVLTELGANIGDGWDGKKFIAQVRPDPSPVVPKEVTLAQARAALMAAGLFTTVDNFIKTSGNPLAEMAWEYTNFVSRDGALVVALAPALGFTTEQLDELFIAAAAIRL